MGYKIYYRELWEIQDKGIDQCSTLLEKIDALSEKQEAIISTDTMKGANADSFKQYMEEIHGNISQLFLLAIQTYSCLITQYGHQYFEEIDVKNNKINNTLLEKELTETVPKRVNRIDSKLDTICGNIKTALNSVSDLKAFSVPCSDEFYQSISDQKSIATKLNEQISSFEFGKDDLTNVRGLLGQIASIIDCQLGANRITPSAYVPGSIAGMVDIEKLNGYISGAVAEVTAITEADWYKDAVEFALTREAQIKELEKEDREWVKWVEIGVAIVGGIALTVLTAGAGSAVAAVAIGAAIGGGMATTNAFLDNYYENGDLIEGMDWKEFSKKVLTGVAVGGISGGFSYVNGLGSALESPTKAVIGSVAEGAAENVAEGVVNTSVDAFCDIGEGIVAGKSPTEVISVTLDHAEQNVGAMLEDIIVDMPADAVSGYVGNVMDARMNIKGNGKPNYLQRYWKELVTNESESVTKDVVSGGFKVIGACVDGDDSTTIGTALQETGKDLLKDTGKNFVDSFVDAAEKPDNVVGGVTKAAGRTATGVADNVIEQVVDSGIDTGKVKVDFNKMKQDMVTGEDATGVEIGKSMGQDIGGSIHKQHVQNTGTEMQDSLKRYDTDHDGKVEFVSFDGDYSKGVTKADFEAAKELAGKGAYKDQSVQNILGLDEKTNINKVRYSEHTTKDSYIRKVDIDYKSIYSRKTKETTHVSGTETYGFSHHKKNETK